ncbi:MAG: TrmH family RNA methyltransferase [Flavobacteriaceae bacterium]
MGISKNQIKLIQSLRLKKNRNKHQLFVAEGVKVVKELLASSFVLDSLYIESRHDDLFSNFPYENISALALKKISALKSPNGVLALFKIPKSDLNLGKGLTVALEDVNDPGNLGTIIRLCDWYGVKNLVCSKQTVDCFNEKVVQATMGSLSRVSINYCDLESFLSAYESPVFCADMEGENLYKTQLPSDGVLVMGNEANGISEKIKNVCSRSLTIPRFGEDTCTESLNVATATAILLSEFRRSLDQ